jgi:hypothetical protein
MCSQEIQDMYLEPGAKFIKQIKRSDPLPSKDIFNQILDCWVSHNTEAKDQIGNTDVGVNPLIFIKHSNHLLRLHSDTKLEGVLEYLKNKNLPWVITRNRNGKLNRICQAGLEPISGFFFYVDGV